MVIRNLKDHISTVYWRRERFPFSSTTSPSTSSGVFKETKVYLIGLFIFWVNHAILFSDYISRKHTRTRKNTQTHTPTKTQQPTTTPQNHFLRMPWRIPICTLSSVVALESHDQTSLSTCADSMPSSYFTLFHSVNITGAHLHEITGMPLKCVWTGVLLHSVPPFLCCLSKSI
jgi:hypothetical protein